MANVTLGGLFDDSLDELMKHIKEYGDNADRAVSAYLAEKGGRDIMEKISVILPVSNNRLSPGAKSSAYRSLDRVFRQAVDGLSVTVRTQNKFHYLYFPDDGSTTRHHYGNQQFMLHGAEAAAEDIIAGAIERLTSKFEE